MSDRNSESSKYETNLLNVSTAGTVRVNKLANIDYLLLGTSIVLFLAGIILIAQTLSQPSTKRLSKKLVLALLLMAFAVALRPLFDYLFANNPNAPLFS